MISCAECIVSMLMGTGMGKTAKEKKKAHKKRRRHLGKGNKGG